MALNFDLKKEYFNTFLLDENKNHEAIGDYTDELEEFSYTSDFGRKIFINQLIITVEDNAKFRYNKYGADIDLSKGIKIYFTNKSGKQYIIGDILPIQKNRDWLHYPCETEQLAFGNQHSFLKITFNFYKNNNTPIVLRKGNKIGVELNDDFSKLENQTFYIEGFKIKM